MELDAAQLEMFRTLYRERFGIELDPKDTLEKALSLVTLMKAIYLPMTEDDMRGVLDRKESFLPSSQG